MKTLATRLAQRKNPGLLQTVKQYEHKWQVKLFADRLEWKDDLHDWRSMPVTGLEARIEAIDTTSRVTATRLLTVGVFALAAKKTKTIQALIVTHPLGEMVFPIGSKVLYGHKELAKAINKQSDL